MGKLRAVFFDIGGTLIDLQSDKAAHLRVLEATRARYGLDVPTAELHRRFVDYLRRYEQSQVNRWQPILELTMEAFQEEMAKLGVDTSSRDTQWFLKTYLDTYRKGVKLSTGTMDVLRASRQLGLHIGILSDIDDTWASSVLNKLRIVPFLDSVTTSEAIGVGKPNPKIFSAALRKARCEPNEAIHVGDSLERDVMGAKRMGMIAVHVSDNPSPHADFQIRTIEALLPIISDLTEARR